MKKINLIFAISLFATLIVTQAYGANIKHSHTDIGTIFFVSPEPGDSDIANGTALLNTLNGITDNSDTNRYLIKLGPGTFNLGSSSLVMKQYVSIEGSGEESTTITAALSTESLPGPGTVAGADNAGLRFVTVKNTGTGTYTNTAAIVNSSASPSISDVTAAATGGYRNLGIANISSSPKIMNVTATASGGSYSYAIYNKASSPKMTGVTSTASGERAWGVYNTGGAGPAGAIEITHSAIKGDIFNGFEITTRVANTQIDGVIQNDGTLTCAGVYDVNYTFYASTCP